MMQPAGRSFQCNWGKSTQTLFRISIRHCFRPRKSDPEKPQNDKKEMVRPWVEVSNYQYERLKKLTEKSDRSLSEIIREAVSEFVNKKEFAIGTTASYLPKGTRDRYKSVSAYFPRFDWNLLEEIAKHTAKCKTHLIRQAVDEYLAK